MSEVIAEAVAPPALTAADKAGLAKKVRWFHSMDLGDGVVTQGNKSAERLAFESGRVFRHSVEGMSVLDVGSWDGYFAFEASRRGASRVLATDWFCWGGGGMATKAGFDIAKRCIGGPVDELRIDVGEISDATVGTFDAVMMLGVFYHLKNPFLAVERLAGLARRMMVLETHIETRLPENLPSMVFYPDKELNGDPTNWWGPNKPCIIAMLRRCGFTRVEIDPVYTAAAGQRGLFHAFRE